MPCRQSGDGAPGGRVGVELLLRLPPEPATRPNRTTSMWHKHIEQDEGGGVLDLIRGRAPSDPLLGLDEEHAELRALDTAAAHPADGDQAAVVQRLEIIQAHLTAIATAAGPLGVADLVAPVLARIKTRMAACAADNAEAQKWSAHSGHPDLGAVRGHDRVRRDHPADVRDRPAGGVHLRRRAAGRGRHRLHARSRRSRSPTPSPASCRPATSSTSPSSRLVTAKERMAAVSRSTWRTGCSPLIRKRIAVARDYATMPMAVVLARARLDALQAEISAAGGAAAARRGQR